MTKDVDPRWIELAPLPPNFSVDEATIINPKEFIVTSYFQTTTVYKYNASKNEFIKFIDSKDTKLLFFENVAYNKQAQKLYFRQLNNIESVELSTNKRKLITNTTIGTYFLFIDNFLHIIDSHNNHCVGLIHNDKFDIIRNTFSMNSDTLRQASAINIPSKQLILLIGGYTDNLANNKNLWIHSVSSNHWKKLKNISFEGYSFGCVLTSNERYIILFGGFAYNYNYECDTARNNIWVLDMKYDNNWKIKKSEICCPMFGHCHGVRSGGIDSKDELLVIGFIKKCFAMKVFIHLDLPPVYIMKLISRWYCGEMIHLIKNDIQSHFGIYLNDILKSL
eukprot:425658_1